MCSCSTSLVFSNNPGGGVALPILLYRTHAHSILARDAYVSRPLALVLERVEPHVHNLVLLVGGNKYQRFGLCTVCQKIAQFIGHV